MAGKYQCFEYVLAHNYESALACYARMSKRNVDATDWVGKSVASLCAGKLEEALDGFVHAKELRERDYLKMGERKTSGADLNFIGTVLWLLGKPTESVDALRLSVDGILDGSIAMGDAAGGISQGLLLWYVSRCAGDAASEKASLSFMKNRSKRKAIENWPGPIAFHLLEGGEGKQLFAKEFGTADLDEIDRLATDDVLLRRHYINALFYVAAVHRFSARTHQANALLHRCARLENPFFELEWYLARHSLEQDYRWIPPTKLH